MIFNTTCEDKMIYGYIRKSTEKQEFKHMEFEIEQYANKHNFTINKWIEETVSSRKPLTQRKLGLLLESLSNQDTVITTEISRLGRSLLEVMSILQFCLNKGCKIITIKENYQLGNDIQSQILAFAFGLAAQIERDLISQRTKSSLASKKEQGIKLGRPIGAKSKQLKLSANFEKIKNLLSGGVSKNKISKIMGVQYMTLSRFIKKMGL